MASRTLLLLAVAGCLNRNPDPSTSPQLRAVDFNDFACKVQPVLARRCAMPACHGVEGHALRVYASGKLRNFAVATLDQRDAPTTLAEVQANFASAQGLTYGAASPDDVPLVRKPLAPSLGGGEHKGGVIFRDANDPDFLALYQWSAGETLPGGCDFLGQLK